MLDVRYSGAVMVLDGPSDFYAKSPHDGGLILASRRTDGGTRKSVGKTIGNLGPVHAEIDVVVLVDDVVPYQGNLFEFAGAEQPGRDATQPVGAGGPKTDGPAVLSDVIIGTRDIQARIHR